LFHDSEIIINRNRKIELKKLILADKIDSLLELFFFFNSCSPFFDQSSRQIGAAGESKNRSKSAF
jgi:hypothetical protein